MTYRALNNETPEYIKELLCLKPTTYYNTRSSTFQDRSFSFIAPKLWNTLPYELRASDTCKVFKRNLKTHLFRLSFN